MRQCGGCLLLWDVDTVVEMRTIPANIIYIQASVIAMLLGDTERETGGTFARHTPHLPCVKVISAAHE